MFVAPWHATADLVRGSVVTVIYRQRDSFFHHVSWIEAIELEKNSINTLKERGAIFIHMYLRVNTYIRIYYIHTALERLERALDCVQD